MVANVAIEVELDDADDAIFVLALPVCVGSVVIIVIISDTFIVIFIIITLIMIVTFTISIDTL